MDSNGVVPEMYWHVMMKWSPWNGNNYFDIDMDGDSLINGIDVDMDADGMPDWWDQDEGSDGRIHCEKRQPRAKGTAHTAAVNSQQCYGKATRTVVQQHRSS